MADEQTETLWFVCPPNGRPFGWTASSVIAKSIGTFVEAMPIVQEWSGWEADGYTCQQFQLVPAKRKVKNG